MSVEGFATAQLPPLSPETDRRPPAYGLVLLMTYTYLPADGFDTARTTIAYIVPAVSVGGLAKFAVKNPPEPLEKPGMVAVARSAPVGKSPLAALIETVIFGVVPVQPLQNKSRSALVNWPLTPAVNVWPNHEVELKPKPLLVTDVFC